MFSSENFLSEKNRLTEHDFNLIIQAQEDFNKQSYDSCLETLRQLEQSMGATYKIKHNKCIAEFYKNACRKYEDLLLVLDNEPFEPNRVKTRSPIVTYNKAVIYFHKRMYFKAIDIILPLVERLDDLEESIVSNVGVLVISCLLATNQLKRALAFLEVIQIHMGINVNVVTGEENPSPEILPCTDGFNRIFKLTTLLTNVLNRKTVAVPEDGAPEFSALKAHQYYLMKDFQMAAKQLSKKFAFGSYGVETHGEDLDTCIANNMGIIHLRVRHYAVAAKFFQNAITFDNKYASNLKNVPLHYLSAPRSREILYNLGISMLHLRRPKEAFECFFISLKTYHRNPRLWFRLAEACIMYNDMSNEENEKKPIVAAIICPGTRRKLIFQPTPRLSYPENVESAAIPDSNLEFAALCLRNALYLYNIYKSKFTAFTAEDKDTQSWSSINDDNICNPSMPISKDSFDNLGAAIYAAFSYVSLRLGDFVLALEYARDLLRMEVCSDSYEMLGHMYSSEALMMMDKLTDARLHLDPKFIASSNAFDFETKVWQVKSIEAAQSIMRYNLVVCMILQGEMEKGKALLTTCTHPIVNSKVVALKTYLDIVAKSNEENEKKPIVAAIICPGTRRKLIFQPTPRLSYPENVESAAIPDSNLEFAALCLRNALYLYNIYKSKFTAFTAEDKDTQSWSSINDDNICNPSMPISKDSFDNLGAAIYAAFSYVSLRLGDFVLALEYARDLLRMEVCLDSYEMLGHMYSSEALMMMDKLTDARLHLDPKFIASSNAFDFETKVWQVKSIEAAQSIMRYNLVVCMILQGEMEKGKALLTTCTHPIVNSKVVALKTYLDIVAKAGI